MLDSIAAAQEDFSAPATPGPPATGDRYLDLRQSPDRTLQRYADRYFNLVKLQEWTSANNKSKIMAKYVAHSPDLKQVTLAAVKGSGATRVVREITVDVAKLSKTCQSRVRQISVVQTKLDELAAAATEADENQGFQGGEAEYAQRGAPMIDERGAEPAPGMRSRREAISLDQGAESAAGPVRVVSSISSAESADPDPLGFAEIANEAPVGVGQEGMRLAIPAFGAPPGSGPQASGPADRSQWATSYAAFRANFTQVPDDRSGQLNIDWGELQPLQAANEQAMTAAELRNGASRQQVIDAAAQLGEVHWEAGFLGARENAEGEHEPQFTLPSLPEPLTIRFVLEQRESPEAWNRLSPGQPVKFVGRFDILQPNEITVRVRMAADDGR